ncbi:GreA/GreB family elongation factor [Streptomyces californicus]|uniref:GreA/GreB family elongation factor n=1 Tax=Streptomyces californicus TaxID=67351 RepID=UPI0037948677
MRRRPRGRLYEGAVAGPAHTGQVGVGGSATVRHPGVTESIVRIGEMTEVHDQTVVTSESPLGGALLGRRVGDTVACDMPGVRENAVVEAIGGDIALAVPDTPTTYETLGSGDRTVRVSPSRVDAVSCTSGRSCSRRLSA